MTKIVHVVGARPNFMKVSPVMEALEDRSCATAKPLQQVLVHTGQHYSKELSKLMFDDLGMPKPDISLQVGSGTHGVQTGRVMIAFEEVLQSEQPDLMVVVGDVNSTIACALDAAKLGIPVAHVEAGLRSFDRSMPEEINRILTDQISEWLFTTEASAADNLKREGVAEEKIHFVGNVMIDTLLKHREKALARRAHEQFGVQPKQFGVVTLHRPSNVDDPAQLSRLLSVVERIAEEMPLIWPVHPRTRARLEDMGYEGHASRLQLVPALSYLDFNCCVANSAMVITDSGGVQEETTILGVPCITVRENTERPVTVEQGTNVLAGTAPDAIWDAYKHHPFRNEVEPRAPELWDGRAALRIAEILLR